jgi:hypothetical protein
LLVHCNGMKADNADAWALLPGFAASGEWHECGNRCLTRLAESKAPGSIHRKQLPLMSFKCIKCTVNDCQQHHPERFNKRQISFTQRITLHLSEEKQAKNKMQKHKDMLLFQKASTTICCTGLQLDRRCTQAQKPPPHESSRERQREPIHLCLLDGLTQEQSSAVKLCIRN